jgi:hypothetical protein
MVAYRKHNNLNYKYLKGNSSRKYLDLRKMKEVKGSGPCAIKFFRMYKTHHESQGG